MTPTAERLYRLLPAIYRVRDAAAGEPLKALVSVIAEQVAVIEEDLAQLYDDQFIETCAPWVAPYIGDLIGYRPLHGVVPTVSSPRAEIANTIGYRRRKGTAAMLEQVARDVTGWHARAVEFFQRLATTQHLNHVRLGNRSPDLRQWEPLETLDTPFDQLAHTVDVRRIAVGRGRYNIPNVGIFLWRLNSHPWTDVEPARRDDRRYWFSPLGIDTPLFTRAEPKPERAGLSTRMNVPAPISRRMLQEYLRDYYGPAKSLVLTVDGTAVEPDAIVACDLSETAGGGWAQHPANKIGIDPELGRIAFPRSRPAPASVRATFHHGFSADLGGGEYDRSATVPEEFTSPNVWQVGVSKNRVPVRGELFTTLQDAVLAWNDLPAGSVGVIAVMDSSTYRESLDIRLPENSRLLIVAAEWPQALTDTGRRRLPGRFNAAGCRPQVAGRVAITGGTGRGGSLFLNGLLVGGDLTATAGAVAQLSLRHCTVVPGRGFSPEGFPLEPREPSVALAVGPALLEIDHSISGGLRVGEDVVTTVRDSVVDATSRCGVAFAGLDAHGPGGSVQIENATVIGKVHTVLMRLASNTIFLARLAVHDAWAAPVLCVRRQAGCVRFSFVPLNARTPRRFQCHPRDEQEAAEIVPQFTSLRYGEPGYVQLGVRCPPEIFRGADDESAQGAFHGLHEPQRIANLNVRLDEYLRFGLEAGLFFEPQIASRPIVPNAYTYTRWIDLCGEPGAESLPGIGAGLI